MKTINSTFYLLFLFILLQSVQVAANFANPIHLFEWRDNFNDADHGVVYGLNEDLDTRMNLDPAAVPVGGLFRRTSGHWSIATYDNWDVQVNHMYFPDVLSFQDNVTAGVMLERIFYMNPEYFEISFKVDPYTASTSGNEQVSVGFDGSPGKNGYPTKLQLGISVTSEGFVLVYQNGVHLNAGSGSLINMPDKSEYDMKLVIDDPEYDGIKRLRVYESGTLQGTVALTHYIPETVYLYLSAYHQNRTNRVSTIDDVYVLQKGPILRNHEILYVDTFNDADFGGTEDATGLNSELTKRRLYGSWANFSSYLRRRSESSGVYDDYGSNWNAIVNHTNIPDKIEFEDNIAVVLNKQFDVPDGLYLGFVVNPAIDEFNSTKSAFISVDNSRDVLAFPGVNDISFEITSSGAYTVRTGSTVRGTGNITPAVEYDVELLILPRLYNLSYWVLYGHINGERFETWIGSNALPSQSWISIGASDPGTDNTTFDTLIIARPNLYEDGHIKYVGNYHTRDTVYGDNINVTNVMKYFNLHHMRDTTKMDTVETGLDNKVAAQDFNWTFFGGNVRPRTLWSDWENRWLNTWKPFYEDLQENGKLGFLYINDEPVWLDFDESDFLTLTSRIKQDSPHIPQKVVFAYTQFATQSLIDKCERYQVNSHMVGFDHYAWTVADFPDVEDDMATLIDISPHKKHEIMPPCYYTNAAQTMFRPDDVCAELIWKYYEMARINDSVLAFTFYGRWVHQDDIDIPLSISCTEVIGKLLSDPVIKN